MVATFNPISIERAPDEAAAYYDQVELDQALAHQATYYLGEGTVQVRRDLDPRWVEKLGLPPGGRPTRESLAAYLGRDGADGSATLPAQSEMAAYDLTFSSAREVGIHWVNETDPARRAIYEACHRGAVEDAMRVAAERLGWTRRGAGSVEAVAGELAWVTVHHYSSRPTLDLGGTADMPLDDRLRQANAIPGDVNIHSHVLVKNAVLCADGRIGALDSMRLNGIVHELGAIYHTRMAGRMADAGIATTLDRHGIAAAIADTPEVLVDRMSKRGQQLRGEAQRFAEAQGLDWDALPASRRYAIERQAGAVGRAGKLDGKLDLEHYRREIAAAGVTLESAVGRNPAPDRSPEARAARAAAAWGHAADTLGKAFETEAVLDETVLRTHAARALIPLGGGDLADIDAVYQQVRERGVKLNDEVTPLIIGEENGKIRATTEAQLKVEQGVERLTRAAAADHTGALTHAEIDLAISQLDQESRARGGKGFALNPEQLAATYALGTTGKVALAIGVAGAGKTTLLQPIVRALQNRERQPQVFGIATAWRQANELTGAGIKDQPARAGQQRAVTRRTNRANRGHEAVEALKDAGLDGQRIFATAALLSAYEKGKISVDSNTVILIDEVSQLGARNAYRLLQLQQATGCRIAGIGDDKQCSSIEAGPTIDLLRRALPGQVPQILETVRQLGEREKKIAGLFRTGEAAEAIRLKRETGSARLAEGGAEETYKAAGKIWAEMADRASQHDGWTFGISAPTNADVRAASAAIRDERRRRGEITGDDRLIECTDKRGTERYTLALAVGDRIRLFDKTYGRELDGHGHPSRTPVQAGVNGTIVEIRGITDHGLVVRGATGRNIHVTWASLRHKESGLPQINAGEVHTIDSGQGATAHLWCNLLPQGSAAVDARKAYVAESRNRIETITLVNADAERLAIARARGVRSVSGISVDDVWEQVGKNLGRQTTKTSALQFAEAIGAIQQRAHQIATSERIRVLANRSATDHAIAQRPTLDRAPIAIPARLDELAISHTVVPRLQESLTALERRTVDLQAAHRDILAVTDWVQQRLQAGEGRKSLGPTASVPVRAEARWDGTLIRVDAYVAHLRSQQAQLQPGSADVPRYDRAIARFDKMLEVGLVRSDDRITAVAPTDRLAYRAAVASLLDAAAIRATRQAPDLASDRQPARAPISRPSR